MKVCKLSLIIGLLLITSSYGKTRTPANFKKGKAMYERGGYGRALALFSRAIKSSKGKAARNLAYYYQGLTFFELGHYYSSYQSFRNVLRAKDVSNKKMYKPAIKNAVIIADRLKLLDDLGKILDQLPQSLIPSSVAHYSHYAIGFYKMNEGATNAASGHFKSVHPESQLYYKALFYLGVLSTKKKNYKDAFFYFKKVIDLAKGKRTWRPIRELAKLNLARTIYSSGQVEKSIRLYSYFTSDSPYWLTILLESSWPLMRVNDSSISLGNLHTVTSPYYRDQLVGEAYVLRSTVLFALCKYEEMRQTLNEFFTIYDPVIRSMQNESSKYKDADTFYGAFEKEGGLNESFMGYISRDGGIQRQVEIRKLLLKEREDLTRYPRNSQVKAMRMKLKDRIAVMERNMGRTLKRIHKRKLRELIAQREQANYLKVEIVTGEKELIQGQKGLPPKRVVDVETTVAAGYHFWPYQGEYWDDELGSYVYTTESSCVN